MAPPPRDREKLARMEQAVRVLIQGLGEDVEREGLRDTPKRVAKALLDCTQGYNQDTLSTLGTALFHEPIVALGDEGIVLVRDIDFASTSEETLLPFHGCCHVAYRPKDGVVLGLSKLARLAKQYAKRLQTQERLASEIAMALQQSLECHGVAVVLQARHLSSCSCPEERITACVSGAFAAKRSAQFEELLALLDLEDLPEAAIINLDRLGASMAATSSLPDTGVAAPATPDPSEKDTDGDSDDLLLESSCGCEELEAAVQQLLVELGENPHRPGLAGSARRYVSSLLASTSGYHMMPAVEGSRPKGMPGAMEFRDRSRTGTAGVAVGGKMRPDRDSFSVGEYPARGSCCATAENGQSFSVRIEDMEMHCGGPSARTTTSTGVGAVNGNPVRMGDVDMDCGRNRTSCCLQQSSCCRLALGTSHPHRMPAVALSPAQAVPCTGHLSGGITLRLPFASQCEHHMLPFYGSLMVSYIPGVGAKSLPQSAVEQVVCTYTQRLQVQERITHQVADAVEGMLREQDMQGEGCVGTQAKSASAVCTNGRVGSEGVEGLPADHESVSGGVMVVCDAAHMCMVARGVENHSGSTTTFAVRGVFADRPELRQAVLRLFREHKG